MWCIMFSQESVNMGPYPAMLNQFEEVLFETIEEIPMFLEKRSIKTFQCKWIELGKNYTKEIVGDKIQ